MEKDPKSTTLRTNPFFEGEDKFDPSVPTASLQIYRYIQETMTSRSSYVNRASAASGCVKKRQFQRKGSASTKLTPRAMINFMLGDLSEKTLVFFISKALVGPGRLYKEVDFGSEIGNFSFNDREIKVFNQKTLTFKIDDITITGHVDGFGRRNSDGKWELIEIKSTSNFGFKRFRTDGPGDYIKQAHALMLTDECRELGIKEVRFFFLKKETGHIWDRLEKFEDKIADDVITEFKQANSDDDIEPPYELKDEMEGRGKNKKKTGNRIAQFPCTYCPYLEVCHGKHEIEYKKDHLGFMKPIFTFKSKEE